MKFNALRRFGIDQIHLLIDSLEKLLVEFYRGIQVLMRSRTATWILFLAGIVLSVIGIVANGMWSKIAWHPVAWLASLASLSILAAYGLSLFFHCRMATAAAAIWLSWLAYFCGLSPFLSVVLISVAAMAIGSLVVPRNFGAQVLLSILAGLALICGTVGWLLPFPVHRHVVYVISLLFIIGIRLNAIVEIGRSLVPAWSNVVSASPRVAFFSIVAMGLVSTSAWIPTIHFDDLAYHLGLPYQLMTLGYYRMDAASNVWAVSAWGGDVLQAVAQLVADAESRGAVDALWLVLTSTLIWKLCESLQLRPFLSWMAIALLVSIPLTAETLAGMQTEGATISTILGLAVVIHHARAPSRRALLLAAVLIGFLIELKISNLMFVGPLGLWLLWQWRTYLPWRVVPMAIFLAAYISLSSYFYAYLLTGNPTLPLFNKFFHSSYYPIVNFHDANWDSGFSWNILWNIVFHTSKYNEGGEFADGGAGYVLLALSGCLLVSLARSRSRLMALIGIMVIVLPLTQIQYLRYAYPSVAILLPAMLAGVPGGQESSRRHNLIIGLVLAALVLVDFLFMPNSYWQFRQGVLQSEIVRGSKATTNDYAPTRRLADFIRVRYGANSRTLMIESLQPFAAELAGNAFVTIWYDPELRAMASGATNDASGEKWIKLFVQAGANLLIIGSSQHAPALDAALGKMHGTEVDAADNLELWELRPPEIPAAVAPSPKGTMVLKFDTSTAPDGAAVAGAQVALRCRSSDIPLIVTWTIATVDGKHWQNSTWIYCSYLGKADASVEIPLAAKAMDFSVSVMPSEPIDFQLQLDKATASFRRDLAADRDLALRLRSAPLDALKSWNRSRLAARRASR